MRNFRDTSRFQFVHKSFARVLYPDVSWRDVWLEIVHDKYDPSEIFCVLSTNELHPSVSLALSEFTLRAKTPVEHSVKIFEIHGFESGNSKVTLSGNGYDIGCEREPLPAGEEVSITVELMRGRILSAWGSRLTTQTGTVSRRRGERRKIEWMQNREKTILDTRYVYEKSSLADNDVLLQIERPYFSRSFKANGLESLTEIMDRTETDLSDIVLLLSLCSRELVSWYEISIETPKFRQFPRLWPRAKRRRTAGSTSYPIHRDPLIDHRHLVNGGFRRLLRALRSSQHREVLKRAISFEVASHRNEELEIRFSLCHVALETLVNDLMDKDPTVPRYEEEVWRTLSAGIGRLVKSFARDNNVDSALVGHTNKKILELRRIPVANAIMSRANSLGVHVNDLWPSSLGFERGLRQALSIRNDLLHGRVTRPHLIFQNLVRIQVLVERLILKMLHWPVERIWVWHDQDLKWVNASAARRER